ncbi:MAG: DUF4846 domain-containing protein [candidate division Zixibacteria bacterium]|nr:DUF4846 domain-containing protein [candidate division Zixibacteria bacterium]
MAVALVAALCLAGGVSAESRYPWLPGSAQSAIETVQSIAPPEGFTRLAQDSTSFGSWLRHLPLRTGDNTVYVYDHSPKTNQKAHYRILDIDTGPRDLQQCADAVMRLRAEYLLCQKQHDRIHFNFTSGDTARWSDWKRGIRPKVDGNKVSFRQSAPPDSSYRSFRSYLDSVFMYAGTHSLKRELEPEIISDDIRPGDMFIQGGFPGHAVIVIDVVVSADGKRKLMMLAQGFTPAQDMHILKNPNDKDLSPWYRVKPVGRLLTPEWTFNWSDLRRFRD